jgi:hypothetical protein
VLKKKRAKGSSLQNTKKGRSSLSKKATRLKEDAYSRLQATWLKEDAYSRLQGLLLQKERVKSV